MLESCIERATVDGREDRPLVIGGAVEFLQTLLDLLTDQHLHFQVGATSITPNRMTSYCLNIGNLSVLC